MNFLASATFPNEKVKSSLFKIRLKIKFSIIELMGSVNFKYTLDLQECAESCRLIPHNNFWTLIYIYEKNN